MAATESSSFAGHETTKGRYVFSSGTQTKKSAINRGGRKWSESCNFEFCYSMRRKMKGPKTTAGKRKELSDLSGMRREPQDRRFMPGHFLGDGCQTGVIM